MLLSLGVVEPVGLLHGCLRYVRDGTWMLGHRRQVGSLRCSRGQRFRAQTFGIRRLPRL